MYGASLMMWPSTQSNQMAEWTFELARWSKVVTLCETLSTSELASQVQNSF